jgi:hypothetical protein
MKRGVFKILCVGVIVAMSKIWGLQGAMVRITVRWSAPADLGGRTDLYYQVNRSDHEDPTSYSFTVFVSGTTTSYTFCSLRPNTQYCVRVTSHNGVSDQDPDGEHLRTEGECTTTRPTFMAGKWCSYNSSLPQYTRIHIHSYSLLFSAQIFLGFPLKVQEW